MGSVVVVGSLNMDLVASAQRLPLPGETVVGGAFAQHAGGKGANQAVAAAKLGMRTRMLGRVGADAFGEQLLTFLSGQGVDVSAVAVVDGATTGVASIVVDQAGQNSIVVIPGANALLTASDLAELAPVEGDVVLCQLEVPLPTVASALSRARAASATTVLNFAPALSSAQELLEGADVLVLNELELGQLLGLPSAPQQPEAALRAAARLKRRAEQAVVVTLGAAGVVAVIAEARLQLPAHAVKAVDATGAGDAFTGVLAAGLARGSPLLDALVQANAAAACSVQRHGAAASSPTAAELLAFLSPLS